MSRSKKYKNTAAKKGLFPPKADESVKAAKKDETPQIETVKQDGEETPEKAGEKSHAALAKMLEGRYGSQSDSSRTAQKLCTICGEQELQMEEFRPDLRICVKCRDSGVVSMNEAAGLLYITYGNYRRRFPTIQFRYPDLTISQRSLYDIISTNQISVDIHRDINNSDFLQILNDENDKFSLQIVRDIPYGFLEELYVRAFSAIFGKGTDSKEDWIVKTKEYLKGVGRTQQASLLE